ncbi:hypothetical protein OUZ56_025895 [Daphnia magna]|uniref:Uncharacterized protein n=1 Tax=Daphnia magna TaxID=35525 RepID=A0ABQ9ZKA4_9CRUS|nr:hypothetical protein OUZ56_025598 [Daphnia magna]KAK4013380.1 hypothetical protein OUZ56_025895 [Daphnia magna]
MATLRFTSSFHPSTNATRSMSATQSSKSSAGVPENMGISLHPQCNEHGSTTTSVNTAENGATY